jgi:hypothetical protein
MRTSRDSCSGRLDEGCVCFVRALAQASGPSSGELDEAEVDAIREDAWLTASKLLPLSYSFFVQSSAFAAAGRARACLAVAGGGKSLLDLGGAGGGCVWTAAACELNFR